LSVHPSLRTARALLGVSANAVSIGVRTAQQVLLVPLFLLAWGAPLYGDWIAATAAASMLLLLEAGGQTYLVNCLNEQWARGDTKQFNALLGSGLVFYASVCAAGTLLVLASVAIVPIAAWLKLTMLGSAAASRVVFCAGFAVLISLPAGFFAGAYRAIGEYHRGVHLSTAATIVQITATATALWQRAEPDIVVLTLLIPPVITTGYAVWDLRRRHPEIDVDWRHASFGDLKRAAVPSLLFLLLPLSQTLWLQGTVLIVSGLGTGAVALFAVSRTLFLLPRQILGQLNNAVWPEFTSMFAAAETSGLKRLNRSAMTVSFVCTILVVAFLDVFAPVIVTQWTRGRVVPDTTLLHILAGYILLGGFWQSQQVPLLASNRHRELAFRYLWGAVTSLVVGYALGRSLGVRGVAIGMAAGELIFLTFWVGAAAARLTGDSWTDQLFSLVPRAIAALAAGVITALSLKTVVGASTLTQLLICSALYAAVAAPLLLWCLEAKDRAQLWTGTRALVHFARPSA
jgi:O-antigen/teichoic acid export membrane protein